MKIRADLKLIILIFLILHTVCSNMCKYRYTCEENLDESKCVEKINLVGTTEFKLKTCSDKNQYCPFLSLADGQESASCKTEAKLPSYPGGFCAKDEDCVNGIECDKVNLKCVGLADSEICSDHSQCNIGSACMKLDEFSYWCMKQRKVGENCNNSFECENGSGCGVIGGDKKCIAFFSVKNGWVIEDPVDLADFNKENNEVFVSFCKSGFKDKENICRSFMLRDESAGKTCQKDEDCVYYNQAFSENGDNSGEIVNLVQSDVFLNKRNNGEPVFEGACDCVYNLKGDRRCREANIHGDGSKIFSDFLIGLNMSLANPNCHTLERFNCKNNRENPEAYVAHKKNEVFALYSHRLQDAEECISEVIFPFLDRKPKQCPKILCDETSYDTCINAVNSLKNNRTAKVKKCFDGEICSYDYKDIFNSNKNYVASCSKIVSKITNKLPGEPCKTNDDCMKVSIEIDGKKTEINECLDNSQRCKGAKVNETCYDHSSCNAGLFCDITDEKKYICKPQKAVNGSCKSSFECKNDLVCNGLCIPAFSLDIGDNTNKIDDAFKNYACKTRYLHTNGICGSITSNQSAVSGGPVECDFDRICEYSVVISKDKNIIEKVNKQCECGFNKDGKGYCPKAVNDVNTQQITDKVNQLQKESLRNSHHTLARFAGINDGKHNLECFEYYLNNRFYKAESCVKEALNFKWCAELTESFPVDNSFEIEQ